MLSTTVSALEVFGSFYDEVDLDKIEGRFVEQVREMFDFDRVALFFPKHRKGILQGKLSAGFEPGLIESYCVPMEAQNPFFHTLVSGLPYIQVSETSELSPLDLTRFAFVPIVSRLPTACWEVRRCRERECPAFGKKWLRCWMVPGKRCCDGVPDEDRWDPACTCYRCPIYSQREIDATEGVLLVDNSVSGRPIDRENINMLSLLAYGVGKAIHNSKRYRRALEMAIRDDLTGLHNRRYGDQRLLEEMESCRRYGHPLSVLLGDIDHFKNINDTYGHLFGDSVLVKVAGCLQSSLRRSDIIARYGGEEFAIVLPNTEREQAVQVAEKLRRSVEELIFTYDRQEVGITISFGAATYDNEGGIEGLVGRADKALYLAKAAGRNRVGVV